MNKFLAILKDSYREALNTWVIPVMLVLAVLVIVLVSSISFRPITLQTELDRQFGVLNFFLSLNPNAGKPEFLIENVTSSNTEEPWKANYTFDIVFKGGKPHIVQQLREDPTFPLSRRRMETYLSQGVLPFVNELTVTEVERPADIANMAVIGAPALALLQTVQGVEIRFHVTTKGTKINDRMSWLHVPSVLFTWEVPVTTSLRDGAYTLEKRLVNDAGAWLTLLVGVIVTAGFIPNMLRKGGLDLYMAKPISRVQLLIYKYIGGLIFVFILATFTVGGVWIAIGFRTGIWTPHFLALIPLLTFYFAVLYAVSTVAAVFTRSPLVAIAATLFAWGLFFGIGLAYDKLQQAKEAEKKFDDAIREMVPKDKNQPPEEIEIPRDRKKPVSIPWGIDLLITGLHAPCPRTYDIDDRMIQFIAEGVLTEYELKQNGRDKPLPPWWSVFGISGAFIVAMLSLACLRFVKRDG